MSNENISAVSMWPFCMMQVLDPYYPRFLYETIHFSSKKVDISIVQFSQRTYNTALLGLCDFFQQHIFFC